MSILIEGMEMPKSCVECEWRDAEAGGDCELMIRNPFKTYTEQYKHCPFQVISKRYSIATVPPHGRLGDLDALCKKLKIMYAQAFGEGNSAYHSAYRSLEKIINGAPTIIPAEEGK